MNIGVKSWRCVRTYGSLHLSDLFVRCGVAHFIPELYKALWVHGNGITSVLSRMCTPKVNFRWSLFLTCKQKWDSKDWITSGKSYLWMHCMHYVYISQIVDLSKYYCQFMYRI